MSPKRRLSTKCRFNQKFLQIFDYAVVEYSVHLQIFGDEVRHSERVHRVSGRKSSGVAHRPGRQCCGRGEQLPAQGMRGELTSGGSVGIPAEGGGRGSVWPKCGLGWPTASAPCSPDVPRRRRRRRASTPALRIFTYIFPMELRAARLNTRRTGYQFSEPISWSAVTRLPLTCKPRAARCFLCCVPPPLTKGCAVGSMLRGRDNLNDYFAITAMILGLAHSRVEQELVTTSRWR